MLRHGKYLLIVLATLSACRSEVRLIPHTPPTPKTQTQLPSTNARIFLSNLAGRIETSERAHRLQPGEPRSCLALNRSLFAMAQYLGDTHKMNEALALLDDCTPGPSDASVALAKASQLQSMHRFPEAEEALEDARERGAPAPILRIIRDELDWNTGKYDSAILAVRQRASTQPKVKSLARLANLEHSLGNYDAADRNFELAEEAIQDTDPLTVAWLFVQRGHHHMEIGEYASAESFFREAVTRLPDYVAATEHLGEVLALQGRYEESAALYEYTLKNTDNPEFMGALASVYLSLGREEEAADMRRQANAGFLKLIEEFPESMSWHAAEFFLDSGNANQAHALLLANSVLRPNSEAWLGLAKTQQAKGLIAAAKESIDKALAMPLLSIDLFETAAGIEAELGNDADSKSHRRQAMLLALRIEKRGNTPRS